MATKTEAAHIPLSAARSAEYQGRVWVTRYASGRRPHVFGLADPHLYRSRGDVPLRETRRRSAARPGAVRHVRRRVQPSGWTLHLRVLAERFAIDDPAVRRIAEIVHDVDLKDARYQPPEAATIAALVEGIRQAHGDDAQMLQHGMAMFDALYRSFEASLRNTPPARRRAARKGATKRRSRR